MENRKWRLQFPFWHIKQKNNMKMIIAKKKKNDLNSKMEKSQRHKE